MNNVRFKLYLIVHELREYDVKKSEIYLSKVFDLDIYDVRVGEKFISITSEGKTVNEVIISFNSSTDLLEYLKDIYERATNATLFMIDLLTPSKIDRKLGLFFKHIESLGGDT